MSQTPWAAVLSAFVILVAVLVSLGLQIYEQRQRTPLRDWEEATAFVRQGIDKRDGIKVIPHWNDEARVFLPGLSFDFTRGWDANTLSRYRHLWVLTGYGRRLEGVPSWLRLIRSQRFGKVEVSEFLIDERVKPVYDFLDHFLEAKVSRWQSKKAKESCDRWNQRYKAWYCGRKFHGYLHVAVRLEDMEGRPQWCIYAPPHEHHAWLEVAFENVPLSAHLQGHVGMNDMAVRSKRGSETEFEIWMGDQRVWKKVIEPRDPKFTPFDIATASFKQKSQRVSFRIRAEDFFDRFLCFNAWITR